MSQDESEIPVQPTLTAVSYSGSVFDGIERGLQRILQEIRTHADPALHQPVHIAPVTSLRGRLILSLGMFGGVIMIPVAAAVPMLPIWPFAILCIVCAARVSARFRHRLVASRVFNTVMCIIRTRPERIFRWADDLIRRALGA
jgi:hypothetical protein